MQRVLAWVVAVLAVCHGAFAVAAVQSKVVDYQQDGTTLEGYLAWDDAVKGKVPGVLVVHEWWGDNAYAHHRADMLAQAGYVAFALDMYGKGKVTTHPESAKAFAAEALKDPAVTTARFDAGLAVLKADPHVDPHHIAAIGYCFGGGVVLGMARSGADLDAVVTFHGELATNHPAKKGMVHARILVNAGGADPFVPPDQVAAFEKEMKAAGAHFQVIVYPGAKHSFTNPDAASYGMSQLAYDKDADVKSWAAMLKLFKQVFGQ